jgi:Family of unknown function (DUF5681)
MRKNPSRPPARNYEVGKCRTPKATRWKPGQSGNPNGRPKGSKNAATMAKAALSRKVAATVNGRKRQMDGRRDRIPQAWREGDGPATRRHSVSC